MPAGTTILEAAKTLAFSSRTTVPPRPSDCRVLPDVSGDVEKAPQSAPACATFVAEGQVVTVHNEKAREARTGVLEMLLINHPLDCPICDQSGECELQDYTYAEGRADSRYREPKRFNPVEDFGGDVLYVPNRCILCTRCVRFMDDVAQESVLNVSERGDRAYIGCFEGKDLTHPWSGNVVDLCPVGALLSKDFLNKARAWELDRTASVCPGCTQGCNRSSKRATMSLCASSRDPMNRVKPTSCATTTHDVSRNDRRDRATRRSSAATAPNADWLGAGVARLPMRCVESEPLSWLPRGCPTKPCTCCLASSRRRGERGRFAWSAGTRRLFQGWKIWRCVRSVRLTCAARSSWGSASATRP